ncbi:hypothetical protein Aca07nite_87750 [Actinoplanes capillaceus]|uniref:Secreted protein/lipoprotein n=1 Tax=Actinoplanes campanulatus TaxID=113559 RepID=A0ABQ3WZ04_9ACTN|nr:hypothetical protein [Actinoplanes capillaceus]GID51500.1 hypothetical protein Aca07nite_87750 [Actinoplanes capillaceus]
MTERRRCASPVIVVMVATLAACNGQGAPDPIVSSPPVLLPAPTESVPPTEAALAAYRGMWQAYAKAGATADPDEPSLATYSSGDALQVLQSGLAELRRDGNVIKGTYISDPKIVQESPSVELTTLTITDCIDTREFLIYDAKTGALADDEPGGRRAVVAASGQGADGRWTITEFGVQEVGSCD